MPDLLWFVHNREEESKEMERHETGLVTESPEDRASVQEGYRDWASLPFPVVDCLIFVLKDTRRWRLEGRSLRLLNRHWSAAVSMHVEEIRPDATRSIVDEDLKSLSKFERVTSVDISPFLTRPPRYALPKYRKKKTYLGDWYHTKLETIVDVLCQLPKLTHIDIGAGVLIILHCHCLARAREQLSRLGMITSVYVYGRENYKLYGKTHINISHVCLYSDGLSDYSRILAPMIGSLKQLESLEVEGHVLNGCRQFDFLDKVENVKLNGVDSRLFTRLPNLSRTTISSTIVRDARFAPDANAHLNRLVGLSLIGDYEDILNSLSRSRVARNLKVLNIDGWVGEDDFVIPNDVFHSFEQLESLYVRACHFDGASLRGRMPNLRALRIQSCTLTDSDATFVTQFEKLELLSWQKVYSPNPLFLESLPLPLETMTLPKLRSLSVDPILNDSELLIISQQTNLEVLHIGSGDYYDAIGTVTEKGICALVNLHNLRILQMRSFAITQRRIWSSLLSTNLVARLEQLWLLRGIEYPENEEILKRTRRRAPPHMIWKVGRPREHSFHLFDQAYFI